MQHVLRRDQQAWTDDGELLADSHLRIKIFDDVSKDFFANYTYLYGKKNIVTEIERGDCWQDSGSVVALSERAEVSDG